MEFERLINRLAKPIGPNEHLDARSPSNSLDTNDSTKRLVPAAGSRLGAFHGADPLSITEACIELRVPTHGTTVMKPIHSL